MSRIEALITELLKLKLPKNEFAVFGSGPICIRGLREAQDLDLIVTKKLWELLKKKYQLAQKENGHYIHIETQSGIIDIFEDWTNKSFDIDVLIRDADIIKGIRFVKLEKVLEWKKQRAKEKDLKDVKLINDYFKRT